MGVYPRKEIREVKVLDLALLIKQTEDNNQSAADFDIEVFEWKENTKTVFGRRHNIEEVNKKFYSLFIDKCDISLNTKLKVTKGFDKAHNTQASIEVMRLIMTVVYGVEA